jgi:hypothetical protein
MKLKYKLRFQPTPPNTHVTHRHLHVHTNEIQRERERERGDNSVETHHAYSRFPRRRGKHDWLVTEATWSTRCLRLLNMFPVIRDGACLDTHWHRHRQTQTCASHKHAHHNNDKYDWSERRVYIKKSSAQVREDCEYERYFLSQRFHKHSHIAHSPTSCLLSTSLSGIPFRPFPRST